MNLWSRLRQSFWFFPALLCVAAVVLAEGLISLDQQISDSDLGALGFLITRVGESGSRDLLGAIAGSMLTVASTTFSITIAVLALSSSTYGPRLVRNFMADRGNQLVLGIFVATFLYCLMVLRSIRVLGNEAGDYFVPHMAVNMAMLLALVSIGVLVYFIHHISDSVQVWTLADRVRTDLLDAVDRLYPEGASEGGGDVDPSNPPGEPPGGSGRAEAGVEARLETDGVPLTSQVSGYVQSIDLDALLSLAHEHDFLVLLTVRPGKHVVKGDVVAFTWPPVGIDEDVRGRVRRAVQVGRARTPREDVGFPALLLEEMAVRALSPGTNDPYTAITALDGLASGLTTLAARPVPSPYRHDREGELRVIAHGTTCMNILEHLLDAMRFYSLGHPTVLHRTLDLVAQVGAECRDRVTRVKLDTHVTLLIEAFTTQSPHLRDLELLTKHAVRVRGSLLDLR